MTRTEYPAALRNNGKWMYEVAVEVSIGLDELIGHISHLVCSYEHKLSVTREECFNYVEQSYRYTLSLDHINDLIEDETEIINKVTKIVKRLFPELDK